MLRDAGLIPVDLVQGLEPDVLAEFKRQGFRAGLRIDRYRETTMGHAGMFSLLARTLTRCCSSEKTLPPVLKNGQQLTR